MANEKMTMRTFLESVINTESIADEVKTFAESQLEKLNAKNEAKRNKMTPTQEQNEVTKAAILEAAEAEKVYTAAEIGTAFGITTQKASALMRALVAAGKFSETETKANKSKVKGYILVTNEG
jgi:predicted HTH transcriptional regulator